VGAFLESMAWPFAACLVLAGIHVYLGIHVLARKVIFVDLALAQIAALGTVWGVLLGWDVHEDPWQIKGFSLAFCVLGAAVFSITRMRVERVPHEAVIGITYAVALAATILLSSDLAHGAEEVRELLTGSILWVRPETVLATAALYAVLGLFHWVFRRRLLALSLDPEGAAAAGERVRLWDFLFYVSFGFVVTSSVSIAGVLLVFAYLVIPAVVAALFAQGVRARLAIGWGVAVAVSAFGMALSWTRDLPSGPTIVVSFGALLALAGALHFLLHASSRARALAQLGAITLALAAFVAGGSALRKSEAHDDLHLLETGSSAERLAVLARAQTDAELFARLVPALPQLLEDPDPQVARRALELHERHDHRPELARVHALLAHEDDVLRETAIRVVRHVHEPASIPALLEAAARESDDYILVEQGEALL
jgi:zinc/manganese transport system permease protein